MRVEPLYRSGPSPSERSKGRDITLASMSNSEKNQRPLLIVWPRAVWLFAGSPEWESARRCAGVHCLRCESTPTVCWSLH